MARVATFQTRTSDEVSLLIEGVEFRAWGSVTLKQSIDAYSTVSFTAPFEPDRLEFRDRFRPFSYKRVDLRIGGLTVFVGTMIDVVPRADPASRTCDVTAYALPAVLIDCPAPSDFVPFEFKGYTLKQIATALLELFALEPAFEFTVDTPIKKAKLEADANVQGFLVELAKQRGLVINNTPEGAVRFWESVQPGEPVANLESGRAPVARVTPSFNPQQYYSEITCFVQAKHGQKGSKYTVKNPHLSGVVRPFAFNIDDENPAGGPGAADAKLGRMFADMAAYSLDDLPGLRDPQGDLWTPNRTLILKAPEAMIYQPTELLVREVDFSITETTKRTTLGLVFTGVYQGEAPEVLPWDE